MTFRFPPSWITVYSPPLSQKCASGGHTKELVTSPANARNPSLFCWVMTVFPRLPQRVAVEGRLGLAEHPLFIPSGHAATH